VRLPAQSLAGRLGQSSERKPSSGMDIIYGRASAITDIRPANTPLSIPATATERRRLRRYHFSHNGAAATA